MSLTKRYQVIICGLMLCSQESGTENCEFVIVARDVTDNVNVECLFKNGNIGIIEMS